MTVLRISCDLCERLRRCVRVETPRGHQLDLCRACLAEAMSALSTPGETR